MEPAGRVMLIINPASGLMRDKDEILMPLAHALEPAVPTLDIRYTHKAGDARQLAREGVDHGYGAVVVAGGDGTVRDVASPLWGSDTTLGILPMGSGNGLARSMGVPMDIEGAIKIIRQGNIRRIDRGMADERPFYCACGLGFDAQVSYKFSQDGRRGLLTYMKHAFMEYLTYEPRRYDIETPDTRITTEALLVAVCNCPQYGNDAFIAPKADPADGLLDVTVVHHGNFLYEAMAGVELFSGRLEQNTLVEMFRVREATITCREGGWIHLDGEPLEQGPVVRISCEHKGLNVFAGKRGRGGS